MAQYNKICQICHEKGHSKFYCRKKPYKPIPKISKKKAQASSSSNSSSTISKVGKKAKKWAETSKEWKKANPPDENGFWYCRVGDYPLTDKSSDYDYALRLNLCHDKSRARHPSLAYDLDNIFPGCQRHNKEQGSRDLDEYLSTNPSLICRNY